MFKVNAISRPGSACLMALAGRKMLISTLPLPSSVATVGLTRPTKIYLGLLRSHSQHSQSFKASHGLVGFNRISNDLMPLPQNICKGKRLYSPIVEEGIATHKPTPFQQRILVWVHSYPSLDKVPERVSKAQMKKAMDKFRIKFSLYMAAMTAICAAVMAFIGRRERQQGRSITKINLEKHSKDKSESEV